MENLSEKVMEEELRTVEFLRGRLHAERVASRNAKEAAELMGNKLVYLEARLKEETKSRNKAEKRVKFLKKKLEAMNLSYVSDESENSSNVEHGEVSSVPFTPYSSTRDSVHYSEEMMTESKNLGADSSESLSKKCEMEEPGDDAIENMNFDKSRKLEFNGNHDLSMADGNSLRTSLQVKEIDAENNLHKEESLAIVPVEMPKTEQSIDPDVLDSTVREVLDSLRHAKEKIQTQMERRCRVKVS